MENRNKITPVGLKGKEINARMIELMGIKPINENHAKSVIELTKIGPDGNAYAIVRENHEYYIKTTNKKSNIITEDFNYIGGLQNKKSEAYPSYAKAIKQLNLKFNSLAESFDRGHNINVFENDNLISERAFGMGFSNEGNLEGNDDMYGEKGGISPLKVMKSRAGYYVGRSDNSDGFEVPYSRDSDYFATSEEAEAHLNRINMSEGNEEMMSEYDKKAMQSFIDQYGEKKGKQVYYATANKEDRDPETFNKNEEEEIGLSEAEQAIEEMMARYDEEEKMSDRNKELAARKKPFDKITQADVLDARGVDLDEAFKTQDELNQFAGHEDYQWYIVNPKGEIVGGNEYLLDAFDSFIEYSTQGEEANHLFVEASEGGESLYGEGVESLHEMAENFLSSYGYGEPGDDLDDYDQGELDEFISYVSTKIPFARYDYGEGEELGDQFINGFRIVKKDDGMYESKKVESIEETIKRLDSLLEGELKKKALK